MDLKRQRGTLVLLSVLMVVAMLSGCGSSSSDGKLPPATGVLLTASTPTAGLNICVNCHSRQTTDWLTSKHANLISGDLYSAGSPTLAEVTTACIACHDPSGDSDKVVAGYTGASRPLVGCESCHGAGSLHANAGGTGPINLLSNTTGTVLGSGPTVTVSGQFVMCTSCHELLNAAGTGTAAAAHRTGGTSPVGDQNIITDTHFATTGDWTGPNGANTTMITGYAMDYSDERVCTTCHYPHRPPTQNREWAQSAHADKNFDNLNSTTPPSGYFSSAWAHYNWSCDTSSVISCGTGTTNPAGPHNDRRACQRCHTTTGFIAFVDALKAGNEQRALDINKGLVSLVSFTTDFKPEMLKCNGCHTDNRGTVRNPGKIAANYDYISGGKLYAKASHTYPDLKGSNLCMTCHVGRETGDTVKGLNDPELVSAGTISSFSFGNMGFVNSHYLTAGGQIFTVTGYEFDGRPYNNINEYLHDKIGTPATQNNWPYVDTGSDGPCIGCHMSRANNIGNHLFLPVSRSATAIGEVTGVTSVVCQKCHGVSSTPILELVKLRKPQFKGALEALLEQIETNLGFYFHHFSPYWYRTPTFTDPKVDCNDNQPVRNWQTDGTEIAPAGVYDPYNSSSCTYKGANNGLAGTGKNNMGAAFNFNLLEHDPGAYAHNSIYVRRLIYDSIDWVDDQDLNFSVGATLDALDGVAHPYKLEAIEYLLPNGVLWNGTYPAGNGIEAERP